MSAINSAFGSIANQPPASTDGYSSLTSQEFLDVILSELTNQDPFEPADTQALLDQVATLRSIESQETLSNSMETLVLQNSVSQAGSLIGQFVGGLNASNQPVEGVVASVSMVDGQPQLKLSDGSTLPMNRLLDIQDLGDLDAQAVQQMLSDLQALSASALIGMQITSQDPGSGAVTSGQVTGVGFENGTTHLKLDGGQRVPIGTVTSIVNPSDASASAD